MFDASGAVVACTVIQAEPNIIAQIKTEATDGYEAVQLAFETIQVQDARTIEKRVAKPLLGHFKKAGVAPAKHLLESRVENASQYIVGQTVGVSLFEGCGHIDVSGVSIGKGYQGVMKLHGFSGGPKSHGSGFHRHAGSTGMRSTPGRCLPGGKRASHMGDNNMTVQSLRVVHIDAENNLLFVEGAVPGAKNSLVVMQAAKKARKKKAHK